ncbi:MAG: hypothetical protein IJX98_03820 [Clostridia bacterium]|nr:hypothetical protein [Clostridia bacterium]
MEEEQTKEYKCKNCFACQFYDEYYIKGYTRFEKQDMGYCRKLEKTVDKHETCDCWRFAQLKRNLRKRTVSAQIHKMIVKLNDIHQILLEYFKETHTDFF